MKSCFSAIAVLLFIVVWVVGANSCFVVSEGQKAIVTRFGAPVGEVREPGLNFKTPFIEEAFFFDTRILKWDGAPNQITTKEKRFIWVDCTARWRIKDPLLFYKSVGTVSSAQSKLDDIIDSVVRDCISANYLVDLVRSEDYKKDPTMDSSEEAELSGSRKTREQILEEMLNNSKGSVLTYGIELIDIQIKRINYIDKVLEKVYDRMISERNKVAAQYRSEGEGQKAEILGEMEKELRKINSEARMKSAEIIGKADAEAARIYSEAYSKDPEFYAFYRSLESLEKTAVSKNSKLVISTDSDLYKYLKNAKQ
ncbi:MAG: protease modulator HflC [Candidatus Riflebacteria bacterium]|nr:protease modulator HflC [Candidatus Riflebacteria bacterium]